MSDLEPVGPDYSGADDSDPHQFGAGADHERRRGSFMSLLIALGAFVGFANTVIWAASGGGYYWPRWVWLGCWALISATAVRNHMKWFAPGPRRRLRFHVDLTVALSLYLLLIWWFSGTAGFWAGWPILSLGLLLVLHLILYTRHHLLPDGRSRALEQRVDTLTRTRRGALDVEAAELRRIERDLHDGAQARLVALSMQLGRAEARLQEHPEAAALVRAARDEAGAAIAELRDLARGIAPPVLTDRGLVAAVQSLADRAPGPVTVSAAPDVDRLPPAVETAAYFVIAEALTNATKHAPGAAARIAIEQRHRLLIVDVADDGPGGADPTGSGLSGLRARVAALDGTLTVASPIGGPTIVHAELPCES